ncbi:MAG: DUF1329 domain-containing protein [Pseudomonadales bacterium]
MFKMYKKKIVAVVAVAGCLAASSAVLAKVSAEEGARLGKDLTPLGAERAGNADGSIPAWTGGGVTVPAGYVVGDHHPDPFADEQPLFEITSANLDQYKDKLSEGQVGLFKAYPDTYKMKIYPTHRVAEYYDWQVENNKKCVVMAELINEAITNAHACTPFPIPANAEEVIWNHILRYQGLYRIDAIDAAAPDAKGRYVLDRITRNTYWPYYDPAVPDTHRLSMFIPRQLAPARVAGDTFLLLDYLDPRAKKRQAWRYFGGQRRVRRAPVFVFDTPIPPSQGLRTIDTYQMFFGSLEKYNWKLLGKREIYIPYNNYKISAAKNDDVIRPWHINTDLTRHELHRVWVIEATLKEGERHIYSRRLMYLDEDSWVIHIHDMYDDRGGLWRNALMYSKYYWESKVITEATEVHHDLISRRYNISVMTGNYKAFDFSQPIPGDSYFTPANIRKLGVR